jgi:non-specific protein-tyrosine kinase
MTEAVATRPVAAATIRKLGLSMSTDDLLNYLQAEQVPATQLIQVSYQDPDPKRAQQIANTVGEVFSQQVAQLSGANGIRIVTWQKAAVPDSPEVHPIPLLDSLLLPRPLALILDGLLGLVVGLMAGVALALVLELLDDSLRSPEEAEQVSGVPTFGVVPMSRATRSRR